VRVADEENLEVTVSVKNTGDAAALPLTVEGELLGESREARLDIGVGPGVTRHAVLRFPSDLPRPGVHALLLRLEWPVGEAPSNGGLIPTASQRAFLLLTLGAAPEPAVRLSVLPLRLETRGTLEVGLESADGRPHRVGVRVAAPRGVNVEERETELEVPERGQAKALIHLLRAGAPRESQQGIVVVASVRDGELERSVAATGIVTVEKDPALLPRLRPALWVLAAGILAAAVYLELRRRSLPATPSDPAGPAAAAPRPQDPAA
jgi:hypothetical protein